MIAHRARATHAMARATFLSSSSEGGGVRKNGFIIAPCFLSLPWHPVLGSFSGGKTRGAGPLEVPPLASVVPEVLALFALFPSAASLLCLLFLRACP